MDSSENIQTPLVPTPSSSFSKKYLFIILGIIIFLIICIFIYLWQRQLINLPFVNKIAQQNSAEKIIAKVGEEYLYSVDIDNELKANPISQESTSGAQIDLHNQVLGKLIFDSILLQGAQQEKLITLNPSIYNSEVKNYAQRLQLVNQAKMSVDNISSGIHGKVVYIWFNEPDSSLGQDKGKQIAYDTIKNLYDQVKSGKISINQAAETISKDTNLEKVDKYYQNNTSLDFNVQSGENITFIPNFDKKIYSLKENEATDIYLAKQNESLNYQKTGKNIDAVYLFAQVTKIVPENQSLSFEKWFEAKRKQYAITNY